MGLRLYRDHFIQLSKTKATRWRSVGCEARQRLLYLHQLFLVSAIARRRAGSVSFIREHVVIGKMNVTESESDGRSWRKAYSLVLSLFAVEVVLLYIFTVRFS